MSITVESPENVQALVCHDVVVVEGSVREIAADAGVWDHKIAFDVNEIQKGLKAEGKADPDVAPMFVEVLVIHEGFSKKTDGTNNVNYTEPTLKDISKFLPGTLGYLGHQEPGKEEFEYRTPVVKYVASRTERRDVKGVGNVNCVIGKGYVSSAARDLRTHLREGFAGPVSISGTALFKANRGVRTNETVGMARLRSVDFCNPGTPGIAGAGVTGVVREIAGNQPPAGSTKMADRLTRQQIESDYPEIVQVIVGEETLALNKTLSEVREQAKTAEAKVTALTAEKTAIEGKVTEMTKAHTEATARAEKAEGEVKEMRAQVRLGTVKDALAKDIDARIETAKAGKDAATEVPVMEMARKRLALTPAILVANDDKDETLSRKAAGAAFDTAVAEVREMAKAFGGVKAGTVSETAKGGTVAGEHAKTSQDDYAKYLPSTAARLAREAKAREGAGAKK